MARDEWEHALVRALVERAFRARLLADPADALAEYGLAAHEVHLVESAQPRSLGELAAHLLWLSGLEGYTALPGH